MRVLQFGKQGGQEILNAHESIYTENGDLNLYAGWNDAGKMDLVNNEVGIAIGLEAQQKFGYATAGANAYLATRATTEILSGGAVFLQPARCLPTCAPKGGHY
jgi:hypothetical protein